MDAKHLVEAAGKKPKDPGHCPPYSRKYVSQLRFLIRQRQIEFESAEKGTFHTKFRGTTSGHPTLKGLKSNHDGCHIFDN